MSASGFSIRSTKPRAVTGPRSGGGGSSSLPTTVPAWAGPARAAMLLRIPTRKPTRMGARDHRKELHSRRQAAPARTGGGRRERRRPGRSARREGGVALPRSTSRSSRGRRAASAVAVEPGRLRPAYETCGRRSDGHRAAHRSLRRGASERSQVGGARGDGHAHRHPSPQCAQGQVWLVSPSPAARAWRISGLSSARRSARNASAYRTAGQNRTAGHDKPRAISTQPSVRRTDNGGMANRWANRWKWRRADRAAAARSFGPLAVAIALAAGIAVAPALDRIGVAPGLRWLGVAAVVVAWRRALRWRGPLLLA